MAIYINEQINNILTYIQAFDHIKLNIPLLITLVIICLILHSHKKYKILHQISILLNFIPVLIHEVGHALIASLLKGKVNNIYMILTPKQQEEERSQGYATTAHSSRLAHIIIAFSGYLFVPLFLVLCVVSVSQKITLLFFLLLILIFIYYFLHTSQKWLPISIIILLSFTSVPEPNTFIFTFIFAVLLSEVIYTLFYFIVNIRTPSIISDNRVIPIASIIPHLAHTTTHIISLVVVIYTIMK